MKSDSEELNLELDHNIYKITLVYIILVSTILIRTAICTVSRSRPYINDNLHRHHYHHGFQKHQQHPLRIIIK